MRVSTKFRTEKDGRIKLEWRFTAEGSRPRSEGAYDDEAVVCDMQASDVAYSATGWDNPMIAITREYVGPNQHDRRNDMILVLLNDNGAGVGGNSEPAIKRYHGWRGTTNNWATYAHGLRRVLDVHVTGNRSKRVVVVLGRDIAEDRP